MVPTKQSARQVELTMNKIKLKTDMFQTLITALSRAITAGELSLIQAGLEALKSGLSAYEKELFGRQHLQDPRVGAEIDQWKLVRDPFFAAVDSGCDLLMTTYPDDADAQVEKLEPTKFRTFPRLSVATTNNADPEVAAETTAVADLDPEREPFEDDVQSTVEVPVVPVVSQAVPDPSRKDDNPGEEPTTPPSKPVPVPDDNGSHIFETESEKAQRQARRNGPARTLQTKSSARRSVLRSASDASRHSSIMEKAFPTDPMEIVDYLGTLSMVLNRYRVSVNSDPDETNLNRLKLAVVSGFSVKDLVEKILPTLKAGTIEKTRLAAASITFESDLLLADEVINKFLDLDGNIEVPETDKAKAAETWAAQQAEQKKIEEQKWAEEQAERKKAEQQIKSDAQLAQAFEKNRLAAIERRRLQTEQERLDKLLMKPPPPDLRKPEDHSTHREFREMIGDPLPSLQSPAAPHPKQTLFDHVPPPAAPPGGTAAPQWTYTVPISSQGAPGQQIVLQLPPQQPGPYDYRFAADAMLRSVPTFSGAVDEYPAWVQAAKKYASIDELPTGTRLTDLKSKLSGKPAQLVRTISIVDSDAIKSFFRVLKREYGHSKSVILAQKQRMMKLAKPNLRYEEMRNFLLELKESMNCLTSLGVVFSKDDPMVDIVVTKLPPSWKQSFLERFETASDSDDSDDSEISGKEVSPRAEATLEALIRWLPKKIKAMRRSEIAAQVASGSAGETQTEKTDKMSKSTSKFQKKEVAEAKTPKAFATLPTDETQARQEESKKKLRLYCHLCEEEGHVLSKCDAFKAMELYERLRFCRSKRIHFACLQKGHFRPEDCHIKERQCKIDSECEYFHHPLLHGEVVYPSKSEGKRTSAATSNCNVIPPLIDIPIERCRCPPECALVTGGESQPTASASEESPESAEQQFNLSTAVAPPNKNSSVKGATLRIFRVFVRPKNQQDAIPQLTVALQDMGSSRCFIDELFVKGFKVVLQYRVDYTSTLHGSKQGVSAELDLEVSRDGKTWLPLDSVETYRNLRLPGPELKWSEFVERNPEFKEVDVGDVSFSQVRLIIGAQLEDALLPLEEPGSRIKKDGISAYKTELGWTIGGRLDTMIGTSKAYSVLPRISLRGELPFNADEGMMTSVLSELRRFNDLEALAIEPRKVRISRQQQEEQAELDKTTRWEDGRITTKMLWKGDFKKLPETEPMARKRLAWLQGKLAKQGIFQKYAETISKDLEKGYIRKLSQEEAKELRESVHWILPHFVVTHPDKPDRPRRVLDCAAKTDGLSLNTLVKKGPNNLSDLWGVTQRFRIHPVVIGGDITEMFSQVRVEAEDQRMLAFLWADEPGEEPDVYVNTRHVFGAKCSPAVANNAVRFAVNRVSPSRVLNVIKEFYMDDWLHGNISDEQALKVTLEIMEALGMSSFVLTKIISNSKAILKYFASDQLAPKFRDFLDRDEEGLPVLKTLGLRWDAEADEFGFSTRLKTEPPKNLAECLGQVASVFDPIQIVGPFLMKGKLLFQSYLFSGKTWKDAMDEDQLASWKSWVEEIPEVAKLSIPRWHGFNFLEPLTLHIFSDSSKEAYGAVGIFVTADGKRSFIAGKGRVINKKKPPTIPRGELQALIVGMRLLENTLEQLEGYVNVVKIVAWVDSAVVLCWTRNRDQVYKEFVANRLAEIFEVFDRYKDLNPEIRWVPTDQNPADLISRSCSGEVMKEKLKFWTTGPDFLSLPEDQWPEFPGEQSKPEELLIEKAISAAVVPSVEQYDEFEDLTSYLKSRIKIEQPTDGQLRAEEKTLIKEIQKFSFRDEMNQFWDIKVPRGNEEPKKFVSIYFKKGPLQSREVFMDDDGILRLVTRLANAEWLNWREKYPAVLSPRHPASVLFIRQAHSKVSHEGARTTYARFLKSWYLPYNAVKAEVFRCKKCRKGNPLQLDAPVAGLHRFRLQPWTSVFHHTGMDFFGPFHIKGGRKVWGLLFTCMTTRAIHLEVCPDTSIPAWLNAIERFISRRGSPNTISCDRATTFVGGSKTLYKLILEQLNEQFFKDVTKAVIQRFQIKFFFIPPRTPHYGGLWERMVRQVQETLIKSTQTVSNLSFDALSTYLVKAEGVINSRPLAIGDNFDVITPASILAPATEAGHGFASSCSLTRVLGQLRQLVDHFWRTWTDIYIRNLSASRLKRGSPGYIELKVGDAVLFKRSSDFHRLPGASVMEAGSISKAHVSGDGVVRRYDVQDKDGRVVDVPVKRVFLAEQDLVDQRGPALGSVPVA